MTPSRVALAATILGVAVIALIAIAVMTHRIRATEGMNRCTAAAIDASQVQDGAPTTVCLDPSCSGGGRLATIADAFNSLLGLGNCVKDVHLADDPYCPTNTAIGFTPQFGSNVACHSAVVTMGNLYTS